MARIWTRTYVTIPQHGLLLLQTELEAQQSQNWISISYGKAFAWCSRPLDFYGQNSWFVCKVAWEGGALSPLTCYILVEEFMTKLELVGQWLDVSILTRTWKSTHIRRHHGSIILGTYKGSHSFTLAHHTRKLKLCVGWPFESWRWHTQLELELKLCKSVGQGKK